MDFILENPLALFGVMALFFYTVVGLAIWLMNR